MIVLSGDSAKGYGLLRFGTLGDISLGSWASENIKKKRWMCLISSRKWPSFRQGTNSATFVQSVCFWTKTIAQSDLIIYTQTWLIQSIPVVQSESNVVRRLSSNCVQQLESFCSTVQNFLRGVYAAHYLVSSTTAWRRAYVHISRTKFCSSTRTLLRGDRR